MNPKKNQIFAATPPKSPSVYASPRNCPLDTVLTISMERKLNTPQRWKISFVLSASVTEASLHSWIYSDCQSACAWHLERINVSLERNIDPFLSFLFFTSRGVGGLGPDLMLNSIILCLNPPRIKIQPPR